MLGQIRECLFHSGSTGSSYCGATFLGSTVHLVNDPNGIGAHIDDPGPLNPLHWVTSIFAGFSDPAQQYTCSATRGCSANR